ncbi:GlxA family transcriptional regulator [Rhodobacteraceae bacterium NNCM2]|nr:GlxA family transcriptional regulator [Coraliihabitans acroporae]
MIAFLLIRQFSLLALVSALEPLRGANRLLGEKSYAWKLFAEEGLIASASNGMEIGVHGGLPELFAEIDEIDYLFVCAGLDTKPPNRARLHAVLTQAARNGIVIGSLSAGTFILARAGLLDGYDCTVHWEFQPAFEEEFPDIKCSPGLFVIDRNRWTGSGGVTGLDMMLQLVEADHGPSLSRSVGNQFQIDRIRNSGVHQRPGNLDRMETLPGPLQNAINLMMANIETPLKMDEIARECGLNLRRMERLFKSYLEAAPAQFYRRLRLEKARELLMHSNLSTLEISFLTGFSSSSHFAMAYAREYGLRPSEMRRPTANDGTKTNRRNS